MNGENGRLLAEIINKKIEERKKILNALIIPDDYIRMYIGDYYIEGKPDGSIQFGKTEAENNEYFCAFLIELYCSNPMFKKMKGSISNIAASIGSFHFPWVLKPQGIILSSKNQNINNEYKINNTHNQLITRDNSKNKYLRNEFDNNIINNNAVIKIRKDITPQKIKINRRIINNNNKTIKNNNKAINGSDNISMKNIINIQQIVINMKIIQLFKKIKKLILLLIIYMMEIFMFIKKGIQLLE